MIESFGLNQKFQSITPSEKLRLFETLQYLREASRLDLQDSTAMLRSLMTWSYQKTPTQKKVENK